MGIKTCNVLGISIVSWQINNNWDMINTHKLRGSFDFAKFA